MLFAAFQGLPFQQLSQKIPDLKSHQSNFVIVEKIVNSGSDYIAFRGWGRSHWKQNYFRDNCKSYQRFCLKFSVFD